MSIQIMSLDPADVNVERHTSDNVVKIVFEDYFTERNEKILGVNFINVFTYEFFV
jgi:hypothetical protein